MARDGGDLGAGRRAHHPATRGDGPRLEEEGDLVLDAGQPTERRRRDARLDEAGEEALVDRCQIVRCLLALSIVGDAIAAHHGACPRSAGVASGSSAASAWSCS